MAFFLHTVSADLTKAEQNSYFFSSKYFKKTKPSKQKDPAVPIRLSYVRTSIQAVRVFQVNPYDIGTIMFRCLSTCLV